MSPAKSDPDDAISIGELAHTTELAVSALRYYDEVGLIEPLSRHGGKRWFARDAIGRVSFIQRAKEAGFSLTEIAVILDDTNGEWRDVVDAKIAALTERRARIDVVLTMLKEIRACGCEAVALCPLSQARC